MTELRWVLLALGILVIGAIYLYGQGIPQRWLAPIASLTKAIAALRKKRAPEAIRVEPAFDEPEPVSPDEDTSPEQPDSIPTPNAKIVTLRFIPEDKKLACDKVVLALRAAGLKHGRYGIFHKQASETIDEPMFSVANLTEPGSFDIAHLADSTIPGMSFFMVLPGQGDPVDRFDSMVETARSLARELRGELRDDKGSSWSIQRERYIREEIIEYCRLLEKPSSIA